MSKPAIGIVVLVLATLLSSGAIGRGHGGHGGHGGGHHGHGHGGGHRHFGGHHGHFGGHHRGGRFAISRSFSGGQVRGNRAFAVRSAAVGSGNYRNAMNSLSRGGGLRNGRLLSNPVARSQVAAGLAVAGWQGGRAASGWWQHGNGGYGWVGPLFWPFAYHDIYDYAIWGDGIGFWDYGYTDIYAGIFAPYGYDDLARYVAQRPSGRGHRGLAPLAQMCGDDSRAIVGLPINQILVALQPNEVQFAALDDLGNASITAARNIGAGCPAQIVLTATGRLAAMEQRLQAMTSAVAVVQPPLEKFYGLLDDEQKARFNALAADQRKMAAANNAEAAPAPGLRRGASCRDGMAVQRDRSQIATERHPARHPASASGHQRRSRRDAEGRLSAGRRHDAAGAVHRHRQAARYHAASRQAGARRARGFLRHAERRAEGAVRGDRTTAIDVDHRAKSGPAPPQGDDPAGPGFRTPVAGMSPPAGFPE
jgi:hypothetical protein